MLRTSWSSSVIIFDSAEANFWTTAATVLVAILDGNADARGENSSALELAWGQLLS